MLTLKSARKKVAAASLSRLSGAQPLNPMWQQSRIFTSTKTGDWYFQMLNDLVRPWRAQFGAAVPYFFTRYLCPLGVDDADTEIAQLPANFRQNTQQYGVIHRSLRFRFVEDLNHVAAPPAGGPAANPLPAPPRQHALDLLLQQHPGRYWRHDFRPYGIQDDLGSVRFSEFAQAQINERTQRGEKIAVVLQANCDLALDLFGPGGIETNSHELNLCLRTPVQSLAHLLNNVWWDESGSSPALWAHNDNRSIHMKI